MCRFVEFSDVCVGDGGDAVECHGGDFLGALFIIADGAGFYDQLVVPVDALA